jgi:hypothetical protein
MSAADTLLARLAGVKSTGNGRWMAKCPSHEDESPSLSIRETESGLVLVHDFGGCSVDAVLQALNLSLGDLFPGPLMHHSKPIRGGFTHAELLCSLEHEVFVAMTIIQAACEGELTAEATKRLERCAARISTARVLAYRG